MNPLSTTPAISAAEQAAVSLASQTSIFADLDMLNDSLSKLNTKDHILAYLFEAIHLDAVRRQTYDSDLMLTIDPHWTAVPNQPGIYALSFDAPFGNTKRPNPFKVIDTDARHDDKEHYTAYRFRCDSQVMLEVLDWELTESYMYEMSMRGTLFFAESASAMEAFIASRPSLSADIALAEQLQFGEIADVIDAIAAGPDLARLHDGRHTAGHIASRYAANDALVALLDAGADVNAIDAQGTTLLHAAAQSRGSDTQSMIATLINAGLDVNAVDRHGNTPLHYAAKNWTGSAVCALLEAGANVNCANDIGETPTILAAREGNTDGLAALLNAGAKVDSVDRNGASALHCAAQHGCLVAVRLLLEKNADCRTSDKDGNTPLHLASQDEDAVLLQELIAAGAEIDALNNKEETPLYLACLGRFSKNAKLLLSHGADPDHANNEGSTPLFAAAAQGYTEHAQLLLEHKADINHKNHAGATAIFGAASLHEPTMTSLLIAAGAAVDVQDVNGNTPMHCAARLREPNTAQVLLSSGAPENANNIGDTPLHEAAKMASCELLKLLLESGADHARANAEGLTPKELVIRSDPHVVSEAQRLDAVRTLDAWAAHCAAQRAIQSRRATPAN